MQVIQLPKHRTAAMIIIFFRYRRLSFLKKKFYALFKEWILCARLNLS